MGLEAFGFLMLIDLMCILPHSGDFLSIEWNLIRLDVGGPAHGIVTKTVHKTLPGGGGGPRGGWVWEYKGWWEPRGWGGGGGLF